ncbi:glycoside hydrolase family 3 protein [Xylariaceae sp. FL0804]|nr:glycoside hydrolase family 3 protein [Xylariaceae sp. FL0804]
MRVHSIATTLAAASAARAAPADASPVESAATAVTTLTWEAAYTKANASLAKMSSQDKIDMVTGIGWNDGPCVGNTAAISSIDYPELCLQDSPLGVRYGTNVTAFTPGIQAGASWNRTLMGQRGQFMAEEMRGCGIHVQLGPVCGPLGKIPEDGRLWEGFGADPYLQGVGVAETIEGMQSVGVQATVKHFILNEQELNRDTMSADIDDRTLHELYLWPFMDAVYAGVASVMCSYNKINSTWSCENPATMNILKEELGFQGYIMTDWNGQHTTAGSANAGLDMTMPGSDYNGGTILWGPQLAAAVSSGEVAQSRVDDMCRRILAAWYKVGQDTGYPAIDIDAAVQGDHKTNVRAIARDGIVLLKNDGGVLPLAKPAKLGLVGSAVETNPAGANACSDHGCDTGALGMGWGSGTATYPYFVSPQEAITARAQADGTTVTVSASDDTGGVGAAVSGADVALVFLTADSGEGYITVEGNLGDRNNLDPWHSGNELVQAVAAASDNVVVVVHSVGPVILDTILAQPSVRAVVWAGLPSAESGNALVDVLYGDVAPSGKLPYTIAKSADDYNAVVVSGDDDYPEKLFVDYRHFDQAGIAPRYEFGFGLSYTNFTYSDISVTGTPTSGPATGSATSGGPATLWDDVVTVTATVANSGAAAGAEVAQLYVGYPAAAATPPKQLRGFDKVGPLAPGGTAAVSFNVRRRDLSVWDVPSQQWTLPAGAFSFMVGASSRDIRLTSNITVA